MYTQAKDYLSIGDLDSIQNKAQL